MASSSVYTPGPAPSSAVTTTLVKVIPYGATGASVTLTVLPWPTGVVFPTVANTGPITVAPSQTSQWNQVSVAFQTDGYIVWIEGSMHNVVAEGTEVASTPPPSQSTPVPQDPSLSIPPSQTPSQTPSQALSQTFAVVSSSPLAKSSSESAASVQPTVISSRPKNQTGISGGAVAGIAIGCLIVGALIAGLCVWLCVNKSRKRRRGPETDASALALMHPEKGAAPKVSSFESGSPISQVMENGLPQPLEDKAISGEISKISNLIKNHVQSYYHTSRVSPGLLDLDDLQALGDELPISTGTLSTLLGNTDMREIALRFCIAWVIVPRMIAHRGSGATFLPPEIAQCLQSMAFIDRGSRVQAKFLARWRALSAELMQSIYVRNSFSDTDPRNASIQSSLQVLDRVLLPYADSRMDKSQRRNNLEEILRRAANFAFTLFSQPSTWDFDWQEQEGLVSGSLCIFPALLQITDESGESIKPPRAFSEAVVRRLDG